MRKYLGLFATVAILFAILVFSVNTSAAVAPSLAVSSAEASRGDTVTVDVEIKNNTGFAGLTYKIEYDDKVLQLNSVKLELGASICAVSPDNTYFVYAGLANVTGDGKLLTLSFTVKNNVAFGDTKITVIPEEGTAFYYNGTKEIDFNLSRAVGTVKISCSHKNTVNIPELPAKCSEGGFTAGVFCNDCSVYVSGHEPISKTGNHTDADGKYETDSKNHYHTCSCGHIFDKEAHNGGEAYCDTKAKCSVCDAEYGENNKENHRDTELKNAYNPTCKLPGYTGDTYCKFCGEKISEGSEIPSTGSHVDADGKWDTDEVSHFHTCGCGEIFDKATHNGNASCTKKAKCEVCGVEHGEPDLQKHALVKISAKDATHDAEGNTEYYSCTECGKLYKDSTASELITLNDTVIPKGEHSFTDKSDAQYHWKECDCKSIIEKSEHIFGDWVIVKDPDIDVTGLKKKTCNVCGYELSEDIPALPAPALSTPALSIPATSTFAEDEPNDNSFVIIGAAAIGLIVIIIVITVAKKKSKSNR